MTNAARGDDKRSTRSFLGTREASPSFSGMGLLLPVESVHALHAVDAAVAHRLAAPDVGAAKLTAGLQKHLDA